MKIALLTCENLPNGIDSDALLLSALIEKNIDAKHAIWNDQKINWLDFDVLIFRSTWDYYEKETEFNNWLNKIEQLGIKTLNAISIINQNKHKFYLRDFEKQGIKIIPTVFIDKTDNLNIAAIIPSHWNKTVIKPAYSGGSYQTELFDIDNIEVINQQYKPIAAEKELLLQQFMPEIKTCGETSIIFFNKKFMYAVNKQAVNGDFRIQEQFGGIYSITKISDEITEQAQKIIDLFDSDLLYARVDGIIIDNELHLMEVECLEPDLYFNLSDGATEQFVDAIIEQLNQFGSK